MSDENRKLEKLIIRDLENIGKQFDKITDYFKRDFRFEGALIVALATMTDRVKKDTNRTMNHYELLRQLDEYGVGHTVSHKAAKRIRQLEEILREIKSSNGLRNDEDAYQYHLIEWGQGIEAEKPIATEYGQEEIQYCECGEEAAIHVLTKECRRCGLPPSQKKEIV